METEKFPFDYDSLGKGDYIPAEKIENILEISRTHEHYQLKLMNLRTKITSKLRERGLFVVIKGEHRGLRILEDEEAAEYCPSMQRNAVRRIARYQFLATSSIDRKNLTTEKAMRLDRELEVNAKLLLHARRERHLAYKETKDNGQPLLLPHEEL